MGYSLASYNASAGVCLTPACIHAASGLLYNLSPQYQEIDPCTNFEEMVCGGWRQQNFLGTKASMGTTSIMASQNDELILSILEGSYPNKTQHSAFSARNLDEDSALIDQYNFAQLQQAYSSCLDEQTIKAAGIAPLLQVTGQLSSLLSNSSTDLSSAITFMEAVQLPHFFDTAVLPDPEAPMNPRLIIVPQSFSSTGASQDATVVAAYQGLVGLALSAIMPNASTESTAQAVVKLEADLAAVAPAVTKEVLFNNRMSLADTAQLAPKLGIGKAVASLAPSNYTGDVLFNPFPGYFGNLSQILDGTPKETVKAYLLYKVVATLAERVDAPELTAYKTAAGTSPTGSRRAVCLELVQTSLQWLVSRYFVDAKFSQAAKTLGEKVILDIQEQFKLKITKATWMDEASKAIAKQKVDKMARKIGYPDVSPNIMDPLSLKKYYGGINMTTSYFGNYLQVSQFTASQKWGKLGKRTDRTEWGMSAAKVNAQYDPLANDVTFPAAIMQFPIFSYGLPGYLNYGGFGAVAGHEVVHGFDDEGRLYDPDGVKKQWWTDETISGFTKRAECFVKQYDNFTVIGTSGSLNVNGTKTLGENLADAGGLEAAYAAWQAQRGTTPDQHLPGLQSFSQEQLFFLAWGNAWCAKATPAAYEKQIATDVHSPNRWRVDGAAMQNSRRFREAFKCPVREPVCELW